jgi:putative ABC transport system permease protein
VITQDAILSTFRPDSSHALTLAVAGIAAISLIVAGILVMNVMLVAVNQRTAEIGLLKAIGATSSTDIRRLFFAEAVWLSFAGAISRIRAGTIRQLDAAPGLSAACLPGRRPGLRLPESCRGADYRGSWPVCWPASQGGAARRRESPE